MSLGKVPTGPTLRIRVPADAPQRVKDAAVTKAIADYRTDQHQRAVTAGTVTPKATDTKYGNCGASTLEFRDAIGMYYTGYVDVRWVTDWAGTAYRVNTHVWDTSAFDPSAWNYPATGNLNGSRFYRDDYYVNVDESGAKYGAKMDRGEVYIPSKKQWCYTKGPSVDNVTIS